jgi:hypothetical protein
VTIPVSTPPAIRLSVLETVGASYDALWEARDDALRLAAVPAGLFLLLQLFIGSQFPPPPLPEAAEGAPQMPFPVSPWFFAAMLLGLVPATLFSCNWLRVLLLGPAAAPGLGLRWGWRETRFLIYTVLIPLIAMLAALAVVIPVVAIFAVIGMVLGQVQGPPPNPGAMPSTLLILAGALPVVAAQIYVAIRLMLALPAAALDRPQGLRLSANLTRGNVFRIFLAFLLGVFPFYVGIFVLELLLGMTGIFQAVPLTGTLLVVLVSLLLSAAGSAVMATVYRRLGGASRAQV